MATLTFDAANVEPAVAFDLLPPGKYEVQVVQSEMRPTRAGDGQLLWLEMDILSGQFAGRKIWDQLNLVNRNATTVEIAQRRLSAICHALGQIQVSDSEQLHFRPLVCVLKAKAAGPDKHGVHREASNEVNTYEPIGGRRAAPATATPPRPGPRPTAAPAAEPAPAPAPARTPAAAVPPWRRQG